MSEMALPPAALIARFRADAERLTSRAPTPDEPLGVAVSGGPDSLALLLLACAAYPRCAVAATVDHGLRPAAAAEAAMVGELCGRLGVPHVTLRGDAAQEPRGSVQDRARRLRYRLLGAWGERGGAGWIATGHHRDDQAETFLMRAARGAGVGGLAGVRTRTELAGMAVPLIRPVLGWTRAELAAIAAGLAAVDDPANRDPAHDRTAFRALLRDNAVLRAEGLARAAANLADAERALDWTAGRLAAERLHRDGEALLLTTPLDLPRELLRRLVLMALAQAGGALPPRGGAVERLIERLSAGVPATLAGVIARPGPHWRFAPAPARRAGLTIV